MPEPLTPYLEILSCEKSLAEAMQNADLVLLDQLIHEDLVFVIPSGQTITKNADLDSYRAGTMQVFSLVAGQANIQMIGDIAVVSVVVELKGQFMKEQIDGRFHYLRVWKRENEQWKVIAGSSTPV